VSCNSELLISAQLSTATRIPNEKTQEQISSSNSMGQPKMADYKTSVRRYALGHLHPKKMLPIEDLLAGTGGPLVFVGFLNTFWKIEAGHRGLFVIFKIKLSLTFVGLSCTISFCIFIIAGKIMILRNDFQKPKFPLFFWNLRRKGRNAPKFNFP